MLTVTGIINEDFMVFNFIPQTINKMFITGIIPCHQVPPLHDVVVKTAQAV